MAVVRGTCVTARCNPTHTASVEVGDKDSRDTEGFLGVRELLAGETNRGSIHSPAFAARFHPHSWSRLRTMPTQPDALECDEVSNRLSGRPSGTRDAADQRERNKYRNPRLALIIVTL